MASSKIKVDKSIKIDKDKKDIKNVLKNLSDKKVDKKVETIDARKHVIDWDFDIYNKLQTNGVTIISK